MVTYLFAKELYIQANNKPNRKRKVGGGNKGALKTVEQKLFYILFYFKREFDTNIIP